MYENNWKAKTLNQLEIRIRKYLKEIDLATAQQLMGIIEARLDKVRKYGVIEKRI